MLYKIINPSDAYTMQADEDKVAIAACVLLGQGQYFLDREDDAEVVGDLGDLNEYIEQHKREVALALDTVTIGDFDDRKQLARVLGAIEDQATRDKVAFEWHDSHRSSMNDIGSRARALSCNMQGVPVSVPAVAPVLVSG